jgi:hypothetical protein
VRALDDFREELRFATADRTQVLRGPGMALLERLRSHMAYEESLLHKIERAAGGTKPRRAARRKRASQQETAGIPYTMEPHPEL